MDITLRDELLSEVDLLSPGDAKLVLDYARTLRKTGISQSGQVYLEMLANQGVSPVELMRATQAVQRVESRLAKTSKKKAYADLEKRTSEHMRKWMRERGMDYDTMTEEQFEAIVDDAVKSVRKSK